MYSIAYFSPTGNTKFLANKLMDNLDQLTTQFIDITCHDRYSIEKNNHLIIMFSIHAFNAPPEVISFVKSLPESLFNNISIIAVGCNTTWLNQAASLNLRKILIDKGYSIALDRVVAMPLTFVAKLPVEANKKTIVEAEGEIKNISMALNSHVIDKKIVYKKAKLISSLGKTEKYAARLFGLELYAKKNCISCGLCWSQCPSKNIKAKNGSPKFGFKCSMCMRCIYQCPQKAITPMISKFIPFKEGYDIKNYTEK